MFQGEAYQILPDFSAEFTAEPPRVITGKALAEDHELLWETVIAWVQNHRKLIDKVTGRLRPHFPGNIHDIRAQAQVIAFEALRKCAMDGDISLFVPLFCSLFRNSLISLCHHVPIEAGSHQELESLPDPNQSPYFPGRWPHNLSPGLLDQALTHMLPSQGKVWRHFVDRWDATMSAGANAAMIGCTHDDYYRKLHAGINRVARAIRKAQP